MSLFFIEYRENDRSKYCIHHENYSYYVNQQIVVYHSRGFGGHGNTYYDQKFDRDCIGNHPILHFLGRFQ